MCRLLLIIDTNYDKNIIVNFLEQSIIKKNTPEINSIKDFHYHKDGFGLAWKSNNKKKWIVYKKSICYINDKNINTIIDSIEKNIVCEYFTSEIIDPKNFKTLKDFINEIQKKWNESWNVIYKNNI